MRQKALISFILLATLAALAAPAGAQCDNLIFRVTQGDYEQSFNGGETIVLRPNAAGNMRLYHRSDGPTPTTMAAEYGHPSKFGYRGMDPIKVRQVFKMEGQEAGGLKRGNVRFTTAQPGHATLGYRITGSGNPATYRQVPKSCLSGVLNIQVQGGGQAAVNPAPSRAPGSLIQVAGRYDTDFGEMTLEQSGNSVHGTYDNRRGRIRGTLEGNILIGDWTQHPTYRPPSDAGEIKFTFGAGGNFTGGWRHGNQGQWESWNGQSVRR